MRPLLSLAAAACLLGGVCLSGCFQEPERSAGVDDFPNSIYARVDGFLDEGRKAEGLDAALPADSLLAGRHVKGPALPKAAVGDLPLPGALPAMPRLAKTVPASGLASVGAAQACDGFATFGSTRRSGDSVFVDTLVYCKDWAWTDTVAGNEHIARLQNIVRDTVTGRVVTGEYADADGDGILNSVPGGESKARVRYLVVDGGVTEKTHVVIGDGQDDNFDTQYDNPTYEMSWSRIGPKGDTLGASSIADGDSDGVAIYNNSPCTVDIAMFSRGPTADNPDAVWTRFEMRTMSFYGKVQTSYPTRFLAESENRDGRRTRAVVRSLDGEEYFGSYDTVLVRFTVTGTSPTDTLDTLETALEMKIGNFDDKGDDSTYALRVRVAKKLGEEKAAAFDFRSDKPILNGRDPESGALAMRVDYADGTALDVEGIITAETVDVTAEMRDGKRIHAVWDRTGKRISLEQLD